jgi:hypothetical protein
MLIVNHASTLIEPPGSRLDEGDEAMEESLSRDPPSLEDRMTATMVSSKMPAQEQGTTFLNPNPTEDTNMPIDKIIRKTKLIELYETTNESTDGASKKRRTVEALGSNPTNTQGKDPPSS